jgi:beta-ribofuranosylaminobenzene 5'-phosphate synthase
MHSSPTIEISVPSRIVVSLIGLSNDGYRINGGIGWAMDKPRLVVRASQSSEFKVLDRRLLPLDAEELGKLLQLLEQARSSASLISACHLEIVGDLLPHRGQGGGTALRLAALEGLYALNDTPITQNELVCASKRGGTSGVGVRTYFEGGFVFDVGHKSDERPRPSHAWTSPRQPLNLVRLNMPDWPMGICVPTWLPSASHAQEQEFFATVLPIPHDDVANVLYQMVFGALSAVAEDDLETFVEAINALQKTAWKAAEWARYGDGLTEIAGQLRNAGARGIGMSSLGPTLYFDASQFQPTKISSKLSEVTSLTRPSNLGRSVSRSQGRDA